MELTFSPSQRFRPKPKLLQLISDCYWAYSVPPNSFTMGVGCVVRLLYWHGILKHTKKHFLGKYFKMDFFFDTSSDGAAVLYIHPYIEYTMHRFIKEWVTKDSICFDIGSHVGYYPLLCSSLGGFTHSFEANPEMVRLQKINLLLNDFEPQVKINELAVSDKNSFAYFYCQPKGRAGISSLLKDPLNPGTRIKVKTITLDSYIKSNKIKRIDFLKIDVEGGEGLVFAGLKDNLAQGRVKAIMWESNYRSPKEKRFETIDMLSKFGYKHYALDYKAKKIRPWIWGDEDCLSIHRSVAKDFNKFINSIKKKYAVLEI